VPLLADVNVQFCLATVDPEGNPTTGITRRPVSQPAMGLTEAVFFSDLGGVDNWDAQRYINIRVVDMGGSTLGKATFPNEVPPEKDGLLIDPHVFGSVGLSANNEPSTFAPPMCSRLVAVPTCTPTICITPTMPVFGSLPLSKKE